MKRAVLIQVWLLEGEVYACGAGRQEEEQAPALTPNPSSSPMVIKAMPDNPTAIPVQPQASSRSPKNATAKRAVKMGIEAIIVLAAPRWW